MKNVVLIGMPGAGKSTVGVLLAKALKMPFIDTDLLIQRQEDNFLQEIIENKGIEAFLNIEEEVVLSIDVRGHVIATGGSVVYRENAMNHLKKNGVVIYLELPFSEIERRLKDIKTRGIARRKSRPLMDVYNERVPLYEKYSNKTIHCGTRGMESIVEEIINIIHGENINL